MPRLVPQLDFIIPSGGEQKKVVLREFLHLYANTPLRSLS